ncbi:MAG: hypothetical protein ACYCY2_02415 [Acidithiobacillus ferriphilus]
MAPLALILLHLSIVPVFMPSVGIGEHGQEIISNAIQWSAVVQDHRAQIPDGAELQWRVRW